MNARNIDRARARLARALGLLSLVSSTAYAQAEAARIHPGTFSLKVDNYSGQKMAPGPARTAAYADAQRVLDILRADAALANPVGYSVAAYRIATDRVPSDAPGMPYHSAVFGALNYFWVEPNGTIELHGGSVPFHVAINTVGDPAEIEDPEVEADGGPRVMLTLKKTGEFRGRPVYNGSCTYITRRPVPPVIPVTQERFLTLELLKAKGNSTRHEGQRQATTTTPTSDALQKFLRERPQREAANKKTLDALRAAGTDAATIQQVSTAFQDAEKQQEAGLRSAAAGGADQNYQDILERAREGEAQGIARIQAQLDALSPSEKKSPAYLIGEGRDSYKLGTKDDEDAILAMQPNAASYDASLPASQPQVLWICIHGLQGVVDSSEYDNYAGDSREQSKQTSELRVADGVKIRDKLDWAALEALVKP